MMLGGARSPTRGVTMGERDRSESRPGLAGLSPRTVAGIVIAILIVVFIALNRDETEISFVAFSAQTALWIALSIAAALGPRTIGPRSLRR
jgi:uncharacterized integral membrane protein